MVCGRNLRDIFPHMTGHEPPLPAHPLHLPLLLPIVSCRRGGCSSPPCCAVGHCSEHCTSPRCPRHPLVVAEGHRGFTSVVPPVGASHVRRDGVRGSDPQHHRPPLPDHQVRPPPPRLSHEPPVGSLTTVTPMPATSSGSHGARLICRRAGCQEPVHPECTTSYCNMHCRSHCCTFHHYSPGNGREATSVLTRTFVSRHVPNSTLVGCGTLARCTLLFMASLISCCNSLSMWCASRRLTLLTSQVSQAISLLCTMVRPKQVVVKRGSFSTSQSGCQRFLVSRTLNAFGGGWCQVLCASAHCMLRTLEWMISSALFSGKSWWRQ